LILHAWQLRGARKQAFGGNPQGPAQLPPRYRSAPRGPHHKVMAVFEIRRQWARGPRIREKTAATPLDDAVRDTYSGLSTSTRLPVFTPGSTKSAFFQDKMRAISPRRQFTGAPRKNDNQRRRLPRRRFEPPDPGVKQIPRVNTPYSFRGGTVWLPRGGSCRQWRSTLGRGHTPKHRVRVSYIDGQQQWGLHASASRRQ